MRPATRWNAARDARGLLRRDPRDYQITALLGLLLYGRAALGFDVPLWRAAALVLAAQAAQWACTRLWRLPGFDPRSALISSLSLCLLLRTNAPWAAVLAAALTVASKFVVRVRGKHVFNPTNIGIVACLVLRAPVWVSPGQWGNAAFFGFLMVCVGGFVVNRAARSDVTAMFLASYAGLLILRALYLGERLAAPLHRMENGALLLFAFFMISDPRTTPDSRAGRAVFAFLVAVGAAFVQFGLYRTNGLLWSLAALSPAVPLIDRLLPGTRYSWAAPRRTATGGNHESMAGNPVDRAWGFGTRLAGGGVLRLLRGQGGREALQPHLAGGAGAPRGPHGGDPVQ